MVSFIGHAGSGWSAARSGRKPATRSMMASAAPIPSSSLICRPTCCALARIDGLDVASVMAAASLSAVSFFCGIGFGPALRAWTRAPRGSWSIRNRRMTDGLPARSPAAVMYDRGNSREQPVVRRLVDLEDRVGQFVRGQAAPAGGDDAEHVGLLQRLHDDGGDMFRFAAGHAAESHVDRWIAGGEKLLQGCPWLAGLVLVQKPVTGDNCRGWPPSAPCPAPRKVDHRRGNRL